MKNLTPTSTPMHHPLRVLIVDDMPQVRRDLSLLLQLSGELEIVGEAANGSEAVSQAEVLHPDVVVMDLEMPEMDGCQATREIRARSLACKIVVLSIHVDPDDVQRAHQAGADVFVPKGARFDLLMKAVGVERL